MGNAKRLLIVLTAGVLVLATGAEATAGPSSVRTVTARYRAGQDSVLGATAMWVGRVDVEGTCGASPGLACVRVRPGERQMSFSVSDKSLRRISGFVRFMRYRSSVGESKSFCQRGSLAVPPGTTRVEIHLDASTLRCGLPSGGVATVGRVNAQLS